MASAIEKSLYRDQGTHGVIEFSLAPGQVQLRVASWANPTVWVQAVFDNAKLTSLDAYAGGDGELNLPWDIIGFDSYELPDGRWKFVLCCHAVEWCFESEWPMIDRRPELCAKE